jgi:hypothetical protein
MPKRPAASRSLRTLFHHRALPAYLRSLSPDALAQICSRVGLSDAAELMVLAPPRQLVRALDASVWKTPRPGLSEVFDPRELLEWLAVWLDIGEEFAAERLGAIADADLTLYFSHLLRVTTVDMWGFERSTEIGDLDRIYAPSYHESVYGHYVATAAERSHWETVRAALDALWQHAPERLLHLFSQLRGDESMLAPQSNRESDNRDFASQRETTRERRGHVTAVGAQAFLALANTPLENLLTLSRYDLETSRHLGMLGGAEDAPDDGPPDAADRASPERAVAADEAELTALRTQMEAAGLLEPRGATLLLTHNPTRVPTLLVKRLARLAADDTLAFEARGRELAYLGSVLIAAIALEGETLTAEEAKGAAFATCNLGLELLEKQAVDARIDREPGLLQPFLLGWQTLGHIPARTVQALTRSLARLQASALVAGQLWMLDDAVSNLAEVRAALSRRDYAAAREAALLLTFVLDPHACRAILPLLDELPHLGARQHRAVPQSRQGIAGQAERPQWIESLADLRTIGGAFRKLHRRRSPTRV